MRTIQGNPYISVEDDGTCWSNEALVCPHCHKPQTDIEEIQNAYREGDGETTCQKCEKDFTFYTNVSHSWTTRKPRKNTLSKGGE